MISEFYHYGRPGTDPARWNQREGIVIGIMYRFGGKDNIDFSGDPKP